MTREYTLPEYGLVQPVSLTGCVTPLLPGSSVPVVFLFDENHTIDECIEQNIANAQALIQSASVKIIGVESHRGGYEWDDYEGKYMPFDLDRFENGENLAPVNDCPKFADCLRSSRAKVLGVESIGMVNQQHCEFAQGGPWFGKPPKDHPLNATRSEHFIRTLLEMHTRRRLSGNLILSAGGDHNSHIEKWIADGSIENRARQKAAYVRVRVPAYRE